MSKKQRIKELEELVEQQKQLTQQNYDLWIKSDDELRELREAVAAWRDARMGRARADYDGPTVVECERRIVKLVSW